LTPEPTGPSLREGYVVPHIITTTTRSAPLGSSAPFPSSSPVIAAVFAMRSHLGCHPEVPRFGSALLPYVPPPLRREESQVHMSDSSLTPIGLPQGKTRSAPPISRLWLLTGRCHDAAVFALCYGPHGCSPPGPVRPGVTLRPPGLLLPSFPRGGHPTPESGITT
jgi:hypothetical protein